jgi:pyruvate formate lyase activating enzyme
MQPRKQVAPGVVRGQWHHVIEDGRVQCDLCPRFCRLREGQRGFCFVRQAREGGIDLTSYGRASGFCIDPIEKKPLNHFYPGTSVLSFGTAGCNLGCRFCQNWDISKARENDRLTDVATPDALAKAAEDAGCKSIAFTYNDPVIFAEYAIDCAQAAHERGIKTVAVSAGYMTEEPRRAFYEHLDGVNIDLKGFTERFYEKLCFAALAPVLETIEYIHRETDAWLELTTLLIPGHNDSEKEVEQLCAWVLDHLGAEVPVHFTAFHPDFKMVDVPATPIATLARARKQALALGLRHVYTGNVHDKAGQSTYCAGCGAMVIERDGYNLGAWKLQDGKCERCGKALAGRFDAAPGHWGARRQRLWVQAGA